MASNRQQVWTLFLLIIVLGFISGSIFVGNLPQGWPARDWFGRFRAHLGLDLQGGAHLVYEADTTQVSFEDAETAVAGVRDVIERRVNALGVSEPIVQTSKQDNRLRIIVELAGVFDVNDAIAQIGATPLLEFRTETIPPEAEEITEEERKVREEFNLQQLAKANSTIQKIIDADGQNFAELAAELSEDPANAPNGGDLGFMQRNLLVPEFGNVLFEGLTAEGETTVEPIETEFGYHIIQRLESRESADHQGVPIQEVRARHILFRTQSLEGDMPQYDPWTNTELGGKQLERAEVQFDNFSGAATVGLIFDEEGDRLFEEITDANVGKRVGIFLDGAIISSPVVQQKISGGRAVITGNFTIPEARELVERLNAGALPVPINLIGQQTVGPTLGAVSVQKSFTAGLIGFALVVLLMLIIYRVSGLLAVIALLFYASIVFSLFKLIPVTLTLAGIAGFLLSIGMAVDANVLIFERLREELKAGNAFHHAVATAFDRAWNSIRDSNVSTLITCLILAWFGTSVIKGFAITLGLGVLVSMFSAIVITRMWIEVAGKWGWLSKKKWFWGA
ncbi:MAG: protein translocase subunit SecD [Patescibacteria group bacterium]|jgi:protein-export membrane protein SecD|nr:protein translocase subunit SecD [Patescibacteria group bacterium]MDP6756515.1 protein translocase subunit SecD [Patescibacteria group bacterium]|tara:strand:+ start:49810 stop:51504 length:1695 start_codon:yes stop_codon:yes gene_type:complete